jgi:SpoVK/Ycf46/Vps4 family AAA+-type ATPase
MSDAKTTTSWSNTNHAHLAAEFARLKSLLLARNPERQESAVIAEMDRPVSDPPAAIDWLVEIFGLSAFERDLLLLCAGVEMDSELAALCGTVQCQSQRSGVTFGLAMATLNEPHWTAFAPSRPLRRFRLLEMAPNTGFTAAPVRINERILHYLAGINLIDSSLDPLLTQAFYPELIAEKHLAIAQEIVQVLKDHEQFVPAIHLWGDDPQGQEDIAALVAHQLGRHLFILEAENLPSATQELEQILTLVERESLLLPAAFLIQCGSSGFSQQVRYLVEKVPMSLFVSSRDPIRFRRSHVRFEINKPSSSEQKQLWQKALGDQAEGHNQIVEQVSQHFRLSARMISSTGSLAISKAQKINPKSLWDSCRSLARPKLEDLAQRIVPNAQWGDLVLPDLQMQILRQLTAQVWHRMTVYESWGFSAKGPRGLGISALFCGDSGTGKTLAAEVLAHEMGLDLYRIDLASVVSKYIGETEKNLKQVFDAAEEGGVVLLFDEADALFGKRGEVKDSHDRYANIEVGYLLQRMESYQGLAILTTNLKSTLDAAFQRRLRFTVMFPFPEAAQREAIWSRVFPSATPTNGLNLKKLSQLNVAGGNIRNIALNAAFLAANAGTPVAMNHLIQATRLEAHKIDRPLAEAEIRGWA